MIQFISWKDKREALLRNFHNFLVTDSLCKFGFLGHPVYISCSERTAGAVDSLTWKDKEFLNSYDHGRQLQMAMTVQNHGECWNPTEAGGRSDGIDFETKSNLTDIV